jgi:hypothetical protein
MFSLLCFLIWGNTMLFKHTHTNTPTHTNAQELADATAMAQAQRQSAAAVANARHPVPLCIIETLPEVGGFEKYCHLCASLWRVFFFSFFFSSF